MNTMMLWLLLAVFGQKEPAVIVPACADCVLIEFGTGKPIFIHSCDGQCDEQI